MLSSHEPCSMLFSMSKDKTIHLGVQSIELTTELNVNSEIMACTVTDGVPGKTFPIVRSNKWLTVIKICGAVAFTGDFLHAGVAAPVIDGPGGVEVDVFFKQLTTIQSKKNATISQYFNLYLGTSKLDIISRLHLTTQLLSSDIWCQRTQLVGLMLYQISQMDIFHQESAIEILPHTLFT